MKKLIPLFIILMTCTSFGQSLSIFNVDTTDFPIMRAKFFAFDKDWKQIRNLSESDFKITENGEERNVLSVSCPTPKESEAISSVLTIDVSGSMSGNNIEIAKEASNAWVKGLPLGKSECAVTAFNNRNQYIQDFTTNRNKLLQKISGLSASGGTDFDAAFKDPIAGGLLALEKAKHKKVMVLITDGYASGNENQILSKAQSIGATVYCVTIGYKCPDILKNISEQTGGKWFENVTTVEEAKNIYNQLLIFAQENEPCEIEWESQYGCYASVKNVTIELASVNAKKSFFYQLGSYETAKLEIFPSSIRFVDCKIGSSKDTTVTITAKNSDFKISNIIASNNNFDVTPKNFEVKKGESKELTVTFTPKDEKYKFTTFDIKTDKCNGIFYAGGSISNDKEHKKTLKLIHPNGGEIFVVGSDTTITWEGILPSDTVSLEHSTDSGNTWNLISNKASNLQYKWENISKPSGNNNLVKISQFSQNDSKNLSPQFNIEGHTNGVVSASWSPDGTKIATMGGFGKVIIWDVQTGWRLQLLKQYNNQHATQAHWSPDGTKIAYIGYTAATIWDANNGELLNVMKHKEYVRAMCWSPDGTKIATTSTDSTAKIWDANSGTILHILKGSTHHVKQIAWSPDGTKITYIGSATATIWDANTGELLHTLTGHTTFINQIIWSPDSRKVATASNDKTAKIWDANSGALLKSLESHTDWVNSISWNNDGSMLATASDDKTCKIWDANSGTILHTLKGYTYNVEQIAWSPDGSKVVAANYDKSVKIWDAKTGKMILNITEQVSGVAHVSWSPDGSKVATSGGTSCNIWDASSGQFFKTLEGVIGYSGGVYQCRNICWNPNGTKLASNGNSGKIWNADNGQLLVNFKKHQKAVEHISWSPDGSQLATASYDKTVKIWDAESGALKYNLRHSDLMLYSSWSPDGSKLATSGFYAPPRIWNATNGTVIHILRGIDYYVIYSIYWSPDGSKVAAVAGRTCAIWDANSGVLLHTFSIKQTTYEPEPSWSPDSQKLAIDKSIWDLESGNLIRTLNAPILHSSWSPDGSKIATANLDSTGKIWDAESGTLIHTLEGHTGYVSRIRWSPDGSKLATLSFDKTAKIWNASNGEILHTLKGHGRVRDQLHWSPDGKRIATGGYDSDRTIKIWDVGDDIIYDQRDTSDAVFSIVAPEVTSQDIDMRDVVINTSKDSVITAFIDNIGQWDCRIDSIYFTGNDAEYFKLNGPHPIYTVDAGDSQMAEFKFSPIEVRDYSAQVVVVTQSETIYQNIRGEGVEPKIQVVNKIIDFGRVNIGDTRDTLNAVTISNVGGIPIHISKTEHTLPNATDFTTINGAGSFTLNPGDTCRMDLRFTANSLGRTTGLLLFHSDAPDSPHQVTLFAEAYAPNTIDIDNIIFAKQPVGTVNDSTVVEYFNNKGIFENKIETIFLADGDFDQFEIKNPETPFYLVDSEKSDLDITFKPTSIGHKQTNLYMVCQTDTIIKTVEGISTSQGMEIITHSIDFGSIELGQRVDSTHIPILRNTGTEDLIISQIVLKGSDVSDFEPGNGFNSLTLFTGDTLFVDIDFNPQSLGKKYTEIEIEHNLPSNIATINVTGEAIEPQNPQILISIPHLEANVSQDIEVPIILENAINLEKLVSTKISLNVKFNSFVMLPTASVTKFEQNVGVVTCNDLDINREEGDTIASIPIRVLLGDKEISPIDISEVNSEDKKLIVITSSGSLKLLDLCEQGGKRLFNPKGEAGISTLSPNPAEDKLQIKVNLIEEGQTKLELYDAMGNLTKTILEENITNPGDRNFDVNLEAVSSGAYTLILTTPTFRQIENVIIKK